MRHPTILTTLVALISILSAPVADAEGQTNDKKAKDAVQSEAQDLADHAKSEKDQAERRGKKNKDKARDAMRDESDGDSDSDDSDSDDSDSDDSDSDDSDRGKKSDGAIEEVENAAKGVENSANRGNAKSQEMRARRDERKAIKEEYKTGDKGEMIVDGAAESPDADGETESSEKKEKKPWWKFWNQ